MAKHSHDFDFKNKTWRIIIMTFSDPAIDRLNQLLQLVPRSKPVNTPTELRVCRCPICGDSSHQDSAHMYIGVREINRKQMIVYDCKLCSSSGLVSPTLLRKLGVYDIQVEEYIKSTTNSGYIKTFSQDDDTSKLQYKYPIPTKAEQYKLDYLKSRLGIDFNDFENIKKYRIVINFSKFLKLNKIDDPRINKALIPLLDQEGCGFVSADKTSISFRNLHYKAKDEDWGLDRFTIVHLYQNIKRPYFYTPPMAIDLLTPYPVIAVTESSFNCINIQNFFYGQDNTSVILGSASRKGCARTIQNLINLTGFVGGKLNVFCDNDKTFKLDYFEKILEPFQSTFDITLYLNEEGKDFGELPQDGISYKFKTIKI